MARILIGGCIMLPWHTSQGETGRLASWGTWQMKEGVAGERSHW